MLQRKATKYILNKGIAGGGGGVGGWMNTPFRSRLFLIEKITSNLTALELSGSYLHTSAPLLLLRIALHYD